MRRRGAAVVCVGLTGGAQPPAPDPDINVLVAAFAHDTGIDSGLYDNPFDNGSFGTQYIQNISSVPAYTWTDAQPDDYCAADACTPTSLLE